MKHLFYIVLILFLTNCSKKNLVVFETKEGKGYKKNNKIIISPRYVLAGDFTDCGIAPVADINDYYYINQKGKRMNIPVFVTGYSIDDFIDGLARFKKNDKIGFIDECGKIVITNNFDYAEPFHNNISIVYKRSIKKYGAINKKGELIIPYKFERISKFVNDKKTKAMYENTIVTINTKGEIIK